MCAADTHTAQSLGAGDVGIAGDCTTRMGRLGSFFTSGRSFVSGRGGQALAAVSHVGALRNVCAWALRGGAAAAVADGSAAIAGGYASR